jgi:phage-related protein
VRRWRLRFNTSLTSRMLAELHMVALHGFIKKTRTAPDEDLALARKRQKELEL